MATPLVFSSVIETGDILDGKYRFERELGRGAMGTVWTAVHESLGQRVAIKIISPEHAGSSELRTRFEREARAAAQLRSRFVVSVFDHGQTEAGLPYIVMEYLEGETLEERVLRLGSLSVEEACRVTRHVARGLAAAHARGIVHRDLKPGNIFIVQSDHDDLNDWTAKILDFGVAKMDDFSERNTTRTGTVIGTPLYMSPEQVRGSSAVDARADLYSLGMVFFNMVTGGFAFDGQSFGDLLISICTDDLPVLSSRSPVISPALDAWFAKSCAKDPNLRFQSAEEMIRALDLASANPDGRRSVADSTAGDVAASAAEQLAATYASPNETTRGGTARALIDSDGGAAVTITPRRGKSNRTALYAVLSVLLLGIVGALALVARGGGADSAATSDPKRGPASGPAAPSTSLPVAAEGNSVAGKAEGKRPPSLERTTSPPNPGEPAGADTTPSEPADEVSDDAASAEADKSDESGGGKKPKAQRPTSARPPVGTGRDKPTQVGSPSPSQPGPSGPGPSGPGPSGSGPSGPSADPVGF